MLAFEADLRVAYLNEANLRKAFLSGADLRHAGLRQADLSGARLGPTYGVGQKKGVIVFKGANVTTEQLKQANAHFVKCGNKMD